MNKIFDLCFYENKIEWKISAIIYGLLQTSYLTNLHYIIKWPLFNFSDFSNYDKMTFYPISMNELNAQQIAAIEYIQGPLLILAGAGSGKTRVITQKIAYLIQKQGYSPKNIYAITFTNKAAREMKMRVDNLLKNEKQNGKIHVSTFHALGLVILRQEAHHLKLNDKFTLFDAIDSVHLLKELCAQVEIASDDNLKIIQSTISNWKNDLISPIKALEKSTNPIQLLAARFYQHYEAKLHAYNAVDFDDLINLPVKLFNEYPDILSKWQAKVRYLLVDEYQDTNGAQYQLINLLAGSLGMLTVVGDDDQSIYAWRGANADNIKFLQDDYPHLNVIKLEQNYRSTNTILETANKLIDNNPHLYPKRLWSNKAQGELIRVWATLDERDELERVVQDIRLDQFQTRKPFSNYAILYRSNHQARPLEQVLREQGLAYQITGGTSFFARTEIKDLFAYFKLLINPLDDAAFLRCVNIPKREIGPNTLEKLGQYAKHRHLCLFYSSLEYGLQEWVGNASFQRLHQFAERLMRLQVEIENVDNPLELVSEFIKEICYEQHLMDNAPNPQSGQKRIENMRELINWLARLLKENEPPNFTKAIQKMMLIDMLERQANEKANDAIQLLTLHAAKGLEFSKVYIIGWEEDCLPHKNSIELETIEEERRLAYVGITRAQDKLTLTFAKQRKRFNELITTTPSRFLEELPEHLLDWEGKSNKCPLEEKTQGQSKLAFFKSMLSQNE